jgi:steroid 5-alpha reductase family enzyme
MSAGPRAAAGVPDRTRAFLWVLVAYLVAIVAALLSGIAAAGRHPLEIALAADVAATLVVFGFSFAFDNSSFYDPYWSVAPPLIGVYFAFEAGPGEALPARQALVLLLVALWAARLTWNWARGWTGLAHEDWRYVDMRGWSGGLYWLVSLLALHAFPTAMVFLGCLPLWLALAGGARPLGALDAVGAALALGGTALEFFADNQLLRFKRGGPPPGATLESGLWAWSRHPNYLGEILFWIGLACFGQAAAGFVWWAWVGAAAMLLMFRFASLPLIERRMLARRPGYEERQRRVSLLIPRPPRKEGAGPR